MLNILFQSLVITLSLVGIFIVFGLIFEQINKITENNLRSVFGNNHYLFTGLIGTPIHEFSHLIMCIVFRHKITKVELFRPIKCKSDGVLGYVNHTYNPKNKYQKIGNFFIGIAPIIVGIILLILGLKYFLPETFIEVLKNINVKTYFELLYNNQFNQVFYTLIIDLIFISKTLFSFNNLAQLNFWIYFILMFSIITHMTLSQSDLKGCSSGIFSFFTLTIVIVLFFNIFKISYYAITNYIITYNIIVLLFMLLGLFFNIICCVISYILKIILFK